MGATHTHEHRTVAQLTPEYLAAPWIANHLRRRWSLVAAISGVIAVAGLVMAFHTGTFVAKQHFFRAYLVGFMFCLGLTMGSLALLMLQHVTGGKWGVMIRRILEASTRNLWLVALMFLGIVAGIGYLYPWSGKFPYELGPHAEHAIHFRRPYMTATWFIVRGVFYFFSWGLFVYLFNRWSLQVDRPPQSEEFYNRLRLRFMRLGGGGLVFYAITITLAAVDWVMSLDPVWYSTIWGMIYMVGQVLLALSFTIVILVMLSRYEPMKSLLRISELHDIGNLTLAFVMLYTYVSFSQFIIIWSGNLPEEVPWYMARVQHGWKPVMVVLVLIHFVLPFLLLLNRSLKRRAPQLAAVAFLIIFARFGDLFWHIIPNFKDVSGLTGHFFLTGFDLVVPVAMASTWFAFFFAQLTRRPLVPAHHHLMPEILEHSHGAH
jgi:hypothetical protein